MVRTPIGAIRQPSMAGCPHPWFERKIDMHMELPEAVTAVRVENGDLVMEAQ